ncbi:Secreted protein [Streptomyces venezuelae]|uniref:peptidase inhibitor family I36 protein n=1 Tax=Streptomyces gardneri TaxID=66892 RepID=UPI0006BD8936|nr:peptidase inhibitor family I36 protein [Streptomyces gardneri]ALO10292.1 Secreted protein [Streptomyces venezuelae]WRK38734.1 peptidase inhibitor family I36 protein [Streptomyces venezuelae]CUM39248.1 putative secreted protein [Streptomyces venezuelae]
MNRQRTLRRWGLALAAVLTLICSAFLVSPASADAFDDCASGRLCLYSASGGAGDRRDFALGNNPEAYDGGWDDRALSAMNNTTHWACFYTAGAYGGTVKAVQPGASVEYPAATGSSHKLAPSSAHCYTGYERCPDNRVCTFTEPNGRGTMTVHLPTPDPVTKNYGNSYGTAAAPASVVNRTLKHACFYPQADFTGTWTEGTGGTTRYGAYVVLRGDSTTVPAPFKGTFRSHELVQSTQECQ